MIEIAAQNTIKDLNMVDFAIACVRGLRNLRERQERGELDTITYLHIMLDLENIVQNVTQTLLFIF